jgi:peptide/nickel transport system permease protein
MAVTSEVAVEAQFESLTEKKPIGKVILGLMRRKPLGAAGAIIVIVMILMAAFADFLTPYDPVANSFADMTQAPSFVHWLGTDQFGRDLLSRIIYGARTALFVGFSSAIIGATTGLVLGVGSAYFGGRIDLIFQRIMDIFMAFPLIIMALAVVSIFGTGAQNVIIAITMPFIPRCARVVRSSALAIREIPYIDAARANGFSHARIILRHMVPNVMAPFLIMITAFVGQAILLEASLSYLGLGVQEPTPAWGLMLQGGAEEYAQSAPWMAIFPGLAISLAVFGFNLFGDAVRDELDPKLRSR